jgi:hypothetical protein
MRERKHNQRRDLEHNQRRDLEHNKNTFQASFPIFFLQERSRRDKCTFCTSQQEFYLFKRTLKQIR